MQHYNRQFIKVTTMTKEEIRQAIDFEHRKLLDFLKLIEKFPLGKSVEEGQINLILDRINELKRELENLKN